MQNPEYIRQEAPQNPAQDYEFLRNEGLKLVQELAGNIWTDYNEHDPGVTILEQLCYALTDLAYRTDFEIQDHLAGQKSKQRPYFLPHQVFPCNALTLKDYRKLLIDSIPELHDVWFFPVQSEENSFRGLYKVYLDLPERPDSEQSLAQILEQVQDLLADHRNLGEDIEEVIILEAQALSLYADIEIENAEKLESVLAKVYYELHNFLNPEIHFYSLSELLEQGYSLQEIFEGPLLKHGFIRDEDLRDKIDRVPISELIKIIMQVEGVNSVKNLYLKQGDEVFENQFLIPRAQKPQLIFGSKPGRDDFTINFYKGQTHYDQIDRVIFRRKLNELESENKRVYRIQEAFTQIPDGRKLQVGEYFSIQNQFPVIYGIGEYGIPHQPNENRKAQARQLKGYLLLFEQVLANYLAQLSQVKELFSPLPNQSQSYYWQSLKKAVPDVEPLLKKVGEEEEAWNHSGFSQDYERGLAQITLAQDNAGDRRNRFLDYLLALHGETYLDYSVSQKNFYFDEDSFRDFSILNKTLFFRYLPQLNQQRGRGFNYTEDMMKPGNLSGLELKLSTLLGFNIQEHDKEGYVIAKRWLAEKIDALSFQIFGESNQNLMNIWLKRSHVLEANLSLEDIDEYLDYIDPLDLETVAEPEGDANNFSKFLFFQEKCLPDTFLREALNWKSFRLGQVNQQGSYKLVYYSEDRESWHFLAEFESYENALVQVKYLWEEIRELNLQTEGLHLLEHILLRPDAQETSFGFFLVDAEKRPVLRTRGLSAQKDRFQRIQETQPHLYSYDNYSVERRSDGDFEILFKNEDAQIDFVSVKSYESVQEIHEEMEVLYEFLADKSALTPFEDKIMLFVQSDDKQNPIPEHFFSNTLSIVLPNWSSRFRNTEFRSVVEDLIIENKPANISALVHWLSIEQMSEFESIFKQWLEAKKKPSEALKGLSNRLLALLLNHSEDRT